MATILDGLQQGFGLKEQYLKNKMLKDEQQAYPDFLQSRNDLQRSNAGLAGVKLQYAPQMTQAELKKAQLENQYYAPNIMADIGYKRAQTGLANQQIKYTPLEMLIKAQGASQSASRFGGAYQLAKSLEAMSAPAREMWIANNQDQYNQMLADLANKQNTNMITPDIINKFIPGAVPASAPAGNASMPAGGLAGTANPQPAQLQQAPMQAAPQAPGGMAGNPQPPMQAAPPPGQFAPSTPDQVNQVKLANQMSANKALTTNATQRQLEGAIQVENIVNDPKIQQQVKDAAQYAGAMGKGSAAIDALSQTNPKAYENYVALKDQTMPLLFNRIKTLDQMGGTDTQREELMGLYKKAMDSATSNPAQFITQFNNLTSTLDTIAQSVQKSATPIAPVNRLEGVKAIPEKGASNQGMVTVIAPNGMAGQIPADKVDAALKKGFKRG